MRANILPLDEMISVRLTLSKYPDTKRFPSTDRSEEKIFSANILNQIKLEL